jgi:adenylate cyclase class 2
MFEVEIKIKIAEPDHTRLKILELGGKKLYNMEHTDVYYNAPLALGDFAKSDEALRLRKTVLIDHTTQQIIKEEHDITYKGPKLDKILKTRVEHVARVLDPNKIDEIFLALGFRKVITIPKHREVFEISFEGRNIEVLIDTVEGLNGHYLEAEMMAKEKAEMEATQHHILRFIHAIGYNDRDSIRKSYLELVLGAKN